MDEAIAKRKADEERKKAEQEAAQKAATAEKVAATQADKRPKRLHDAPKPAGGRDNDDSRRKPGRGRLDRSNMSGARGKQRGHNLSLSDIEAAESGRVRGRGGKRRRSGDDQNQHAF